MSFHRNIVLRSLPFDTQSEGNVKTHWHPSYKPFIISNKYGY